MQASYLVITPARVLVIAAKDFWMQSDHLTTHHSPLTTHRSPLTTHHSPLTTHHSPLTTHHSPLTTHHSPTHLGRASLAPRSSSSRDARGPRASSSPPQRARRAAAGAARSRYAVGAAPPSGRALLGSWFLVFCARLRVRAPRGGSSSAGVDAPHALVGPSPSAPACLPALLNLSSECDHDGPCRKPQSRSAAALSLSRTPFFFFSKRDQCFPYETLFSYLYLSPPLTETLGTPRGHHGKDDAAPFHAHLGIHPPCRGQARRRCPVCGRTLRRRPVLLRKSG